MVDPRLSLRSSIPALLASTDIKAAFQHAESWKCLPVPICAEKYLVNGFYERLIELQESQERVASSYEESGSYEMAYLALWGILEKTLKEIDTNLRKDALYDQICLWKTYFENSNTKKPKEIKSFNLKDSKGIPEIGKIEEHLGKMPEIKEIMNTQAKYGSTKWRDKRNNIAHNAEPFGKKETYEVYRKKILSGVSEIRELLRNKNT